MKDQHDIRTGDLIEPPKRGRGRPKKVDALTPAEKQRVYRQRHAKELHAKSPTGMRESTLKFLRRQLPKVSGPQFEGALDLAHSLGLIDADEWSEWRSKKRNA